MASTELADVARQVEHLANQTERSNSVPEHQWAQAGEALSVINLNDKVIEEKEKELVQCIAENYSRIKGVEKELAGLQLQLRLTSGPKKSALELLRKKIESQNEKVLLARRNHCEAKKVADAAKEFLNGEEAAKDRLCQELNLLVQQSAHAQLERLEDLTQRIELLNRGFTPATAQSSSPQPQPAAPQSKSQIPEAAPGKEASGPRETSRVSAAATEIQPGQPGTDAGEQAQPVKQAGDRPGSLASTPKKQKASTSLSGPPEATHGTSGQSQTPKKSTEAEHGNGVLKTPASRVRSLSSTKRPSIQPTGKRPSEQPFTGF